MNIENELTGDTGKFFINENNETLAEMDYKMKGKALLILHTEVDDKLAGKGVGKKLVTAAVDHARKNALRIKSVCSFAKAILDKTSAFHDVYTPH